MSFLKALKKAWNGIQVDDDNDKRTRYVMVVWSFLLLSILMIACYIAAIVVAEAELRMVWVDLIKHLAYVFGGILSCYFSLESFFPSQARDYPGWGGWGGGGSGWKKEKEVDPKKEPPAHSSEGDAQID